MMNDITKKLRDDLATILGDKIYNGETCRLVGNYFHEIIIGTSGDVNYKFWHNQELKHDYFKFDGKTEVFIETEEQSKEFKNIVLEYFEVNDDGDNIILKDSENTTLTINKSQVLRPEKLHPRECIDNKKQFSKHESILLSNKFIVGLIIAFLFLLGVLLCIISVTEKAVL